jgi:hypothetical protein
MRVEQVVRSDAEKAASKAKAAAKKRKVPCAKRRPWRPKGSKNKPKADGTFTPELGRIAGWLNALLHLIAGVIPLTYLVLDGHFGNHHALQMARQSHLGFDHGVGHPLLLLYDAKAPNCQKNKVFKGLGYYSEWPKVADAAIKAVIST